MQCEGVSVLSVLDGAHLYLRAALQGVAISSKSAALDTVGGKRKHCSLNKLS